ncbi:MAG: HEAT repeat domain-containing protein [Vulcanimicrobiota bacterium]
MLALWEALDDPGAPADLLVEQLELLAALKLKERVPFLGRLPRALAHSKARVRAAAARALAGAEGPRALSWLLELLGDPAPDVVKAAAQAMTESVHHDPARWAHLVFHPRVEVRRLALDHSPSTAQWLNLFLLEDPWLAAAAREQLPDLAPSLVGPILEWTELGTLSPARARHLLRRGAAAKLLGVAVPTRSEDWARGTRPPPMEPDPLDALFGLFWDVEGAFWSEVGQWLSSHDHRARPIASLCRVGLSQGNWPDWVVGLIVGFHPRSLRFAWFPEGARRRGLARLYRLGHRSDRLDDEEIALILQAPPLVDFQGRLDLLMLGALLRLAEDPMRVLIRRVDFDALMLAVRHHPAGLAHLAAPGRHPKTSRTFFERLGRASGWMAAAALTDLVEGDEYEAGRAALDGLTPAEKLQAVDLALELAAPPNPGFSPNRLRLLARQLSEAAPPAGVLERVLDHRDNPLTPILLQMLAERLGAQEFYELATRLTQARLLTLLGRVDHCSAFPFACEVCLASQLERHADRRIADWARARRPQISLPATKASPHVRSLTRAEARQIATCAAAALPHAVEPCLRSPCRGLTAALSQRPCPETPCLEVCLALLGCHDPYHEVDAEFQNYSSTGSDFLTSLDERACRLWLMNEGLPVHGHAWLSRWERHLGFLWSSLDQSPANLTSWLAFIAQGNPRLCEEGWGATGRLLGMWRWRERSLFASCATSSLEELAVAALAGPGGVGAAVCLDRCWDYHGGPTGLVRAEVTALLPDLDPQARSMLARWFDSRGLGQAARGRRVKLTDDQKRLIGRCQDLEQLVEWARGPQAEIVAEAALRLLDFRPSGCQRLLQLLEEDLPQLGVLAESVGLWPDPVSLEQVRERLRAGHYPAEVRFVAALSLAESGEEWEEVLLEAALAPTQTTWLGAGHWERLERLGLADLPEKLATSPHPHAYHPAVEQLLSHPSPTARRRLRDFLLAGPQRLAGLRLKVATALFEAGDPTGLPLLFWERIFGTRHRLALAAADTEHLRDAVVGLLASGLAETELLKWLVTMPSKHFEPLALEVLKDSRKPATCGPLVQQLRRSPERAARVRRVAEAFHWGLSRGRELTGKLFALEMLTGEKLGYTYLHEARIFVNVMPIFTGERHAEDIVKGLMLHEFGHHIYHADAASKAVWTRAEKAGLHSLLNLVSDEHLERNLRANHADNDQKLKRLTAYAFGHRDREVELESLVVSLGRGLFEVLTATRLQLARRRGCLRVRGRDVFRALEKSSLPFGRFVRALRMGLGNRHHDPLVGQALALFGPDFRHADMERLYEITLELQRLFGTQTVLLESLGPDTPEWDDAEVIVRTEGLTPDELRREVERLRKGGARALVLNDGPQVDFPPLTAVVPVAFDPVAHREHVRAVARYARRLRAVFERLGLRYRPHKRRTSGRRLDRAQLPAVVLRGDVRVLEARRLEVETDLFLGLAVDCSGSMQGESLHKARLFATLLAEAGRGLGGIDVRVVGFTDTTLYDAGDANRCAAHNLECSGGNNDAGALDYLAGLALASPRKTRLLVMISDGLPTQCTVSALRALVRHLTRRRGLLCAQVAVRKLQEVCFPHYIELLENDLDASVIAFGRILSRLVSRAVRP